MPIAVCPRCQRRYVIEGERSPQRTCPRCLHPMQLTSSGGAPAEQPAVPGVPEARALNGEPLAAGEIGRRLFAVLAEAGYQSDVARQLRRAARAQRGAEKSVPAEAGAARVRSPALPPAGEAPARGPLLVSQAEQLLQQAREACVDAQMIRGRSRVAREDRQARRDPLPLPPLEYVLLPLPFFPEVADGPEAPPPPPATGATLYVWGYEPPRSLLCREQCEETERAARFAAEVGWEADRPHAWAKEITLPMTISEALRTLESRLRQDPGVAGWGMRSGEG